MADFRLDIGSGVKSIEIYGADGELLCTKQINIGNKTELKRWVTELSGLQKIVAQDESALDELEEMEKKIVNATIGDWDLFWKASGENPIVLMKTLATLSGWINGQLEEMYRGMV